MYADDLLLLSASVSGLQYMLDICYKLGVENDIIFNQKKSVCIRIGPCDVPRLDVLSTASLCPAFLLWTYVTCLLWL